MNVVTDAEIEHIRRVGRDEERRRTTIGLTEFDALCDEAVRRGKRRPRAVVLDEDDSGQWWVLTTAAKYGPLSNLWEAATLAATLDPTTKGR